MRVSGRLSAVALFAGVSLLALVVSGLFDWMASSLFLILECLAGGLRRLFGARAKPREHRDSHPRRIRGGSRLPASRAGRIARRKVRPRSLQTAEADASAAPRPRILLPLTEAQPELLRVALEECRSRRAELCVLGLRPYAVIPMGPTPQPGLADDPRASELLEDAASEAGRAGIPLRTSYELTTDAPATVLDYARRWEVDLVVVGARRRGLIGRVFGTDLASALVSDLPGRASLLVRAT